MEYKTLPYAYEYINLDNFRIGEGHPCFVIAEIGQNHNGSMDLAKTLMRAAKKAGANCVKLQKTYLPEKFTHDALQKPYTNPNSFGSTYGEHREFLEFTLDQFVELKNYAENELKIMFTASPMDMVSLRVLVEFLKVKFIKVGSGDTNNFPFLEKLASYNLPIILSTGMQDLETVKKSVSTIRKYHNQIVILHCVSTYPTPLEDVNLRCIQTLKNEFPQNPVGYSGHELGPFVAIGAVAIGAKVIEKHITLDKKLKGSDQICSLLPEEFKVMVDGIRNVELSLGSDIKIIRPSEMPCKNKLGKSIVAAKDLTENKKIGENDISIKVSEPKGVDADHLSDFIGATTNKCIKRDKIITYEDIELL